MRREIFCFAIAGLIAALPLAAQSQQSQSTAQSTAQSTGQSSTQASTQSQVQSPPPAPSLGDLAKQLRTQQDKNGKKAAKVFTNDNLPSPKPDEAVNTAVSSGDNSTTSKTDTSKPTSPSAKPDMHTKDYWQDKFKSARADLAKAKEMQQLSEDELNLLQIQQVRELDPTVKADLTAKVQAKQSQVEVNKATTDLAQKTLDDLTKEFNESGAPNDWSVTG
jgi:hypothetical protein